MKTPACTPGKVQSSYIIKQVSDDLGIPVETVKQCVEGFISGIRIHVFQHKNQVCVRGFGRFIFYTHTRTHANDPRTGLRIPITPKPTIKFRPGKGAHP